MPDKIVILKESGEQLNSNIVSVFLVPENSKKYIITTENAVDPHGLNILHVSEINGDELLKIATEQEWLTIKNIMRAIISGNVGPYQYEKPLEQAKVNGQYYRDISVSVTASKQMSDNYQAEMKKKAEEEKNASKTDSVETIETDNAETKTEEVHTNPETESLNSLDSAEPIVVQSDDDKKEETKEETVVEQAVPPTESDSVIPTGDSAPSTNSEVSPGISENEEKVEEKVEEKAETPATEESKTEVEEKKDEPEVKEEAVKEETTEKSEESVPAAQATVIEPNNAEVTPAQSIEEPKEEVVKEEAKSSEGQTTTIKIDLTVPSNFGPDASLNEVLVGAQEVFLEGVKNLIQTMTEKIYRDYYEKEKNLKERENALIEREKMINNQTEMLNKKNEEA